MALEQDVHELVQFRSEGASVLSVYLNVDSTQRSAETYRLALRGLLERVAEEADAADVALVERFLEVEYDWQGRGLACFSCDEKGFWKVFALPVPVQDAAYASDRPYVKPLTDLMDTYSRYGVVLVNQEGSRLFIYNLGKLEETAGTLGEEVKHHKQGGWAASRYQRHENEQASQNIKEAAKLAARFYSDGRCRRLLVGGQESAVALFREQLPKSLQGAVVGTFAIEMGASPSEIQQRTLELAQEVTTREKADLAEQVVTAATKGGAATLGIANTLGALKEKRVHRVVIVEGFQAPAHRCRECRHIVVEPLDTCPVCGGEMEAIDDAVDSLVRRSVEQGAEVTFVPTDTGLDENGSIGAILRY